MKKDLLKHYPVGNGDTTLIKLSDGTTILIDCKIREGNEDTNGYSIFDLKSDLLNELGKRDGKPFVDVFILTHPDEDHCLGFENHFFAGKTSDYPSNEDELIIIDEIWVTPIVFTNSLTNDDAIAIRKEAKRRRTLYDDKDGVREDRGNRMIIVGYDDKDNLESIPHKEPSNVIEEFAGKAQDDFSLFIHAPFKSDLIEGKADDDKNLTSIVFQARFRANWDNQDYGTRVLMAGDADHYNWNKIIEKTEENDREECLKWDVLLAPHHCSWTFFNDVPYDKSEENKTPKASSVKLLDEYKLEGALIIASSKLIKNNDDNPPHYPAKTEYVKNLSSKDNFISLAESPKVSEPKPVIFEIDGNGCKRVDDGVTTEDEKRDGARALSLTSASSGNWCNLDEI